jgi:hypothetical protein
MKTTRYSAEILLTRQEADEIDKFLNSKKTDSPDDRMNEGETCHRRIARFPDGAQIDVMVYGSPYLGSHGIEKYSWTQSVLVDRDGQEVDCTEPSKKYLGERIMTDRKGNQYTVRISASEE